MFRPSRNSVSERSERRWLRDQTPMVSRSWADSGPVGRVVVAAMLVSVEVLMVRSSSLD